jgi:hypothetical protein
MEADSKIQKKLNDLEIQILKQRGYNVSDASDVFQPAWLRCAIQTSDGLDRFLLDYGFTFLFRCAFVSWLVFIIQKTI